MFKYDTITVRKHMVIKYLQIVLVKEIYWERDTIGK